MTNFPDIAELLPHDAPMILVDRLIDVQEESVHCQVDIGEHQLFFDNESKTTPAYVGIEFMAQSIAAWSGFHAKQKGETPPIGFLLGSRRYQVDCDRFEQGQTLDIYAEKVIEDSGMAVFSARIELDGVQLASCQLNVYVPSEQKLEEMKNRNSQ
ncbi:hotdog family protein [Vibrio barjaei]|jgi:predicted hotdog family 3-hydroxylacyl-ACP dehydratase|uniref:Hotdog family protein n=1 Tax=Vibrio barjaei TaxID=1676683 RepID=A0ABW7II18_9VIBR|nr:hotdog family protein [Vibrio barjaei]MCY9870642.1 hotdog family protein [Vibrio barjaei]OIN25123.1 3-hydroxydecanoyl-ACP dehydratase [Vibrio barjaei]